MSADVDRIPAALTDGATPTRTPVLVCMSDVQSEAVEWLWYPRLPLAKLCFLDGDPGVGKGFVVAALTATVTRGAPWPDGAECAAGDVILLNAEDGLADTLRPRLDAAGADVSRVHVLTACRDGDEQRIVTLEDLDILRAALDAVQPRFVNVDPVQAHLGAHINMHRVNEVRPVLAALGALAEEYRCTILCTRHLTKGQRDRALYRGLGSIDFAAAARSVLLAGLDPSDSTRRAVAQVKFSLAPKAATLAFAIEDGRVVWSTDRCELTAETLTAPDAVGLQKHTKIADALAFLEVALMHGPRAYAELLEEAQAIGVSKDSLIRASKKVGVVSQSAGFPRRTSWRLASDTQTTKTTATTVTTDSDGGSRSSSSSLRLCNPRTREGADATPAEAFEEGDL